MVVFLFVIARIMRERASLETVSVSLGTPPLRFQQAFQDEGRDLHVHCVAEGLVA